MKREEYLKTVPMTYREYCGHLQQKYGVGRSAYMTASWNKSKKCTRTNEGLFTHHIFEDHAIMLSSKEWAMRKPYGWQLAENLVYCDYLEHLLLHILICEYPAEDANLFEDVGVGGVVNFLVPQLNDLYSGWQPQKDYIKVCFALVREDKPLYLELLKRFKATDAYARCGESCLCKSFNAQYGQWSEEENKALYAELIRL